MKKYTLDKIKLEQDAYIDAITDDKSRSRLMDLGFIKGSVITPVFTSPSRDPVAYRINNSIIALRNEEARYVEVIM